VLRPLTDPELVLAVRSPDSELRGESEIHDEDWDWIGSDAVEVDISWIFLAGRSFL